MPDATDECVSAGGNRLEISLVPPGSTVSVVPDDHQAPTVGMFAMLDDEIRELDLLPYTADGRYIIGAQVVSASVGDPTFVTVKPIDTQSDIVLTGHAKGATGLQLDLDGITVQYQIELSPSP